MEVRIGVQDISHDIVFESDSEPQDLAEVISTSWANEEMITLHDSKGRRILVPSDKIGFIELGPPTREQVGFGVG
ncbi:MAG: DUF3107 domain-containing protein [Candidatus Nanopelagicales bacterium]|nr:DUF3107 domain-containing protein [Candidatus Nanopelagicales bacterium]MDZ4248848.1 DUF3107 domain-containing protein [Candidatus Nanopelagicales bacterium]MDZ7578381.1 DUF3107 domain-containing protein [Candidatus Nanopelagicales bacterium]